MSERMSRRIQMMLSRCLVSLMDTSTLLQTVQIRLLEGEVKDNVEYLEPYGYTATAPANRREGLTLFIDGDRGHAITICVANRQYRLTGLAEGEVAVYDDQGQKIHLTRSGIVVDGAGKPIILKNAPSITADTPIFKMTGELLVGKSVTAGENVSDQNGAKSMKGMRDVYDGHRHHENDDITNTPDRNM